MKITNVFCRCSEVEQGQQTTVSNARGTVSDLGALFCSHPSAAETRDDAHVQRGGLRRAGSKTPFAPASKTCRGLGVRVGLKKTMSMEQSEEKAFCRCSTNSVDKMKAFYKLEIRDFRVYKKR